MSLQKRFIAASLAVAIFMIGCELIELNPSHRPKGTHTANGQSQITAPASANTEPESAEEMLVQLKKDAGLPPEQKNNRYYLRQSARIMAALYYEEMSMRDLEELLVKTGVEPYVVEQEHKGLHTMVRTKKAWPAAKYFEANFVSETTREEMDLANFTFHYQPGRDSFADVQNEIVDAFGPLGRVVDQSDAHRAWQLPEGYYLVIRYLTEDEIELGDIYNAYTEADRGSLVVTVYQPNDPDHHDEDF